jgi:hypothetical protein
VQAWEHELLPQNISFHLTSPNFTGLQSDVLPPSHREAADMSPAQRSGDSDSMPDLFEPAFALGADLSDDAVEGLHCISGFDLEPDEQNLRASLPGAPEASAGRASRRAELVASFNCISSEPTHVVKDFTARWAPPQAAMAGIRRENWGSLCTGERLTEAPYSHANLTKYNPLFMHIICRQRYQS